MRDETTTPAPVGDDASQSMATTAATDKAAGGHGKSTAPTVEAGPIGDPAGTGPAEGDALNEELLRIWEGVNKLLERFDEKLLHDEARTDEIKRLSAELARYQPDAQWNTVRPFVDQMIRHLDGIQRFVQRYERRDDAAAKDFLEALEWLHEDVELALEEHGITAYRPQAGKDPFDGRRHSVVGNPIPTTDPSLSRVIERCVRPGFERDGKVVARAAVRIYRRDQEQEEPG